VNNIPTPQDSFNPMGPREPRAPRKQIVEVHDDITTIVIRGKHTSILVSDPAPDGSTEITITR